MLSPPRRKRREGVDVVIGVVETHGRMETDALIDGLEIIPRQRHCLQGPRARRRWISTRFWRAGRTSCSSTSSRTPTRRAAAIPSAIWTSRNCSRPGIDVYTTLNIQHVESLNDVVAQITRIRVRETVPDSILDRADDIEVVDLTPEDLISA